MHPLAPRPEPIANLIANGFFRDDNTIGVDSKTRLPECQAECAT